MRAIARMGSAAKECHLNRPLNSNGGGRYFAGIEMLLCGMQELGVLFSFRIRDCSWCEFLLELSVNNE
jgi:hypothetical protein